MRTDDPVNPGDALGPSGAIEVTHDDEGSLVRLRGEVDATLRAAASASMIEIAGRGGPVVIDAGRVTFIDSSGLAFILQLHGLSEESGQRCALRDPPALVLELLDLIGMDGRIPLEFTPGDAEVPSDAEVPAFEPTVA
jgi:anti-anti-sigma factor